MITRRFVLVGLVLAASTAVLLARSGRAPYRLGDAPQDRVGIVISGAPAGQLKLAVQDFLLGSPDPDLATAMKTAANVLWDDLDFEHEYYMIPRATTSVIAIAEYNALPMDRWQAVGADYVLVGSAMRSGSDVSIDLRMMPVRGGTVGQPAFSKRYPNCRIQDPRYCAHAIADDFHKDTRNLDGVARTKLAFVSDRDSSNMTGRPMLNPGSGKEVYISDYDGANQLRFTSDRSLATSPNWAPPNGAQLSYTSWKSGFPDIYIANLAQPGRGLRRPAAGTDLVKNYVAVWSPDGTKLAVTQARNGNSDVWIMNADGSDAHNLTANSAKDDLAPTFSPDGTQIAFISDRTGTPLLYVMNTLGGDVQRLTDVKSDRPTWSTLKFIAFTLEQGSGHDIAVYDWNSTASNKVSVLTDGNGSNENPAVAPNGRHIAFVTTRWGKQQIAIIGRDGKNYKRVTEVGNNTYPNWQPNGR
jgi:TolB protein